MSKPLLAGRIEKMATENQRLKSEIECLKLWDGRKVAELIPELESNIASLRDELERKHKLVEHNDGIQENLDDMERLLEAHKYHKRAWQRRALKAEREVRFLSGIRDAEGRAHELADEVWELQRDRADANAKALANRKGELDELRQTAGRERTLRRQLQEVNDNLTRQLKAAEFRAEENTSVAAARFDALSGVEGKLRDSQEELQELEEKITAISDSFSVRPF